MKRFKLIFHAVYILITITLIYFSIDILMNTEAYLSKIKLSSYIKFPRYVMMLFLFISILMGIEYVMQQMRIYQIKQGMQDLKDEIVALKAKLYDKSQDEIREEMELAEVEEDDEEEDDDDDDD